MDMRNGPAGIPVEELLQHRGWVRALARGLATDASAADDLEQEVWLTALRHPPAHASGIRGWLARVVRSRAADAGRSEGARGEREKRSARPEAEPSTERLAEVAELQAVVARAVLELAEPYRSTVLLRYFEELPLEAVAARAGAPLETVRTRLRRAHALLRERLDRHHGGDRRAWLALLAFPHPRTAVPGGILVTVKAKAAVVAAVILLLAGWIGWGRRAPAEVPPPVIVAVAKPPAPPPPPSPPPSVPVIEEIPVPPPEPPKPEPAPPPPPPPPVVEIVAAPPPVPANWIRYGGRVVDERRLPVSGARVEATREGMETGSATSDAEGRFEIPLPPRTGPHLGDWAGYFRFTATAPDGRIGGDTTYIRGEGADPPRLVIVVAAGVSYEVLVSDDRGPVPGAEVLLIGPARVHARARSDAAGRAVLGPMPGTTSVHEFGRALLVSAQADGRGRGEASVPWPPDDSAPVPLQLHLGSSVVAVEVVDADTGKGIPGATLALWERVTAPRGENDPWVPYTPPPKAVLTDAQGRWSFQGISPTAHLSIEARAEGYGDPWNSGARYLVPSGRPLRITLARSKAVRWRIDDSEGPIPPHGTVVTLRRWPYRTMSDAQRRWGLHDNSEHAMSMGTATVRVSRSDGAWLIVEGVGGGGLMAVPGIWSFATAETPDGRLAKLRVEGRKEEGLPTSFRPGRTATVTVRDEEGNPRIGVEVQLKGDTSRAGFDVEYAFTDGAGRAVLPMLYGGKASVSLRDPRVETFRKFRAGTLDLEKGDAILETVYPLFFPVEIRLRVKLDGVPGLPPTFHFLVQQGGDSSSFGDGDWGYATMEEDPREGRIVVTAWLARPAEPVNLILGGPGYYQKGPVTASRGKDGGPIEAVIDLGAAQPRPPADPAARPAAPPTGESLAERATRVLDTERATFEFKETALSEVLSWIAARHGLNIVIDDPIEDGLAGLPVTVKVKDRTVRDAIQEVLKIREDLSIVLRNGIVVVVRR